MLQLSVDHGYGIRLLFFSEDHKNEIWESPTLLAEKICQQWTKNSNIIIIFIIYDLQFN